MSQIMLKTGNYKDKRSVILADESEKQISVTLWGTLAQNFDF